MTAAKLQRSWLAACAALGCTPMAWAQATPPQGLHQAEIYSSHQTLNGPFANWREQGFRAVYGSGAHTLSGEVANMNRFGEDGNFLGVGDTWVWDPLWYGSLSLGAGDGASYLPRWRVDGFVHRKWLSDLSLVSSLGLGHYRAPDSHTDSYLSLGLTSYLNAQWVLQGEAKFNRSRPGGVHTRQYFVAATWGQAGQTRLTGRHGWGEEGYQALGPNTSIARFASHQTTLSVQHWLGPDWGVQASAERYSNPSYRRQGLQLGLFKEWP